MIQDVKDLHAELYVEILRDSLDVVVLEHREVQIGNARAYQDISPGISAQIETLKGSGISSHTIRVPEGGIRGSRNSKTLRLDVIVGITGVC